MQLNPEIFFVQICIAGDRGAAPVWKTGSELLRSGNFLEVVLRTHPDFTFYRLPYFTLNSILNRQHAHYKLQFFYEEEFITWVDQGAPHWAATVLFFESGVSDQMATAIAKYAGNIVVICNSADHQKLTGKNLLLVDRENTSVSRQTEDALYSLLNVYGDEDLPFLPSPDEWADRSALSARTAAVTFLSPKSAFQANQYLLAQRLRSQVATQTTKKEQHEENAVLTNINRFRQQRIVDEALYRCSHHMQSLPHDLAAAASKLLSLESSENYNQLLHLTEEHLASSREPLIIYMPCVNKSEVEKNPTFKRQPDRAKAVLFAKWDATGPVLTEKQGAKSEEERTLAKRYESFVRSEQNIFHKLVSLLALTLQTPAVCLPNLPARLFGQVSNITSRFQWRSWRSANKELTNFGRSLASEIPVEIADYMKERCSSTIFLSDLPMEWLRLDDVPITSWCGVSRLPITPGDYLFNLVRTGLGRFHLTAASAKKLLILNCLPTNDKLFGYPRVFADALAKKSVSHRYLQVANFEQYYEEIKAFSPTILIHIGHGTFDAAQQVGKLQIGNNTYDFSKLRVEPWMAPIVLLAACSTWAANPYRAAGLGFLRLGARSVLAAMMDIQADRTLYIFETALNILYAHLQGRMKAVPLLTWGQVVSHAFTLSRRCDVVLDFIEWQRLKKRKSCPENMLQLVLARIDEIVAQADSGARHTIESTPQLAEQATSEVLLAVDIDLYNDFLSFVAREQRTSHSLYFTHLGLPESIVIEAGVPAVI